MGDGFKPIGEALDTAILTVADNCLHHRTSNGDFEGADDIRRKLQTKERNAA